MDEIRRREAIELRKRGRSPSDIAALLGVDRETVMRVTEEGFAERRAAQIRAARHRRGIGVSGVNSKGHPIVSAVSKAAMRADVEDRLAEIPEDTRDLTARMMGDPIPMDPRRHWLNR